MKLKICTETDYLQAHLTAIEGESRRRNPTWHNLKQRVTSVMKKWLLAANANMTRHSNALLRLRAIIASQPFWGGFKFDRNTLRMHTNERNKQAC